MQALMQMARLNATQVLPRPRGPNNMPVWLDWMRRPQWFLRRGTSRCTNLAAEIKRISLRGRNGLPWFGSVMGERGRATFADWEVVFMTSLEGMAAATAMEFVLCLIFTATVRLQPKRSVRTSWCAGHI